jgi:triphosphatase
MRVGLRRLRAALSIFSEMLGGNESARVKRELKWLTDELGPARQLTVFAAGVLNPLRISYPHEHGIDLLVDEVERRRGSAERRATAAVGSDQFRNLLLDTAEWIQAGDWRTTNDELVCAIRERKVEDFAVEILLRRSTNIGKRGKKLRELDVGERHKLRIAAKKLRYGCEFFANLFPTAKAHKRKRAFLCGLMAFQDCLGDLNDVSAHQALCSSIADETPSRHVAFLAGIASGREEAKIEPLLRSSLRAHRQFGKVEPFWR